LFRDLESDDVVREERSSLVFQRSSLSTVGWPIEKRWYPSHASRLVHSTISNYFAPARVPGLEVVEEGGDLHDGLNGRIGELGHLGFPAGKWARSASRRAGRWTARSSPPRPRLSAMRGSRTSGAVTDASAYAVSTVRDPQPGSGVPAVLPLPRFQFVAGLRYDR
jgi:hypothetical protein